MDNYLYYDIIYKIIVVGDSGVGKSSILLRYTEDIYVEDYTSTIGVDFILKNIVLDNKKIKIQLWDTAGQERFKSITTSYYKNANGIIVVYDVSNPSYNNILKWLNEIKKHNPNNLSILIVGNKIDKISISQLKLEKKQLYDFLNNNYDGDIVDIIYTSAKQSKNINDVFLSIINDIYNNKLYTIIDINPENNIINPSYISKISNKKKCFCI